MDERRRGEIALVVVNVLARKHGIRLSKTGKNDLASFAREINIPVEEFAEFARPIIQGMVEESLVIYPAERQDRNGQ